jgi:hypothetical protein
MAAQAYLLAYADETKVIRASRGPAILALLYTANVGMALLGVVYQDWARHYRQICEMALFLAVLGGVGSAAITALPHSGRALWVGVGVWAGSSGPLIGLAMDLNNRSTRYSELGAALPMGVMDVGQCLFPYMVSWLWTTFGDGPSALPWTLVGNSALILACLVLMAVVKNDYRP